MIKLKYFLKRMLQMIVVLICVSIFSFALIRLAGGDPARMVLPEGATEEAIAAMRTKLGLDKPYIVQYLMYIRDVLSGDFGISTQYQIPVITVVAGRLPYTILLCSLTVILGCCLCIPLGIIAGANKGKPVDFAATFFALLGQSMSPVWLAILNVFIFGVWLGILPTIGADSWKNLVLPVCTLAYPMAAEITRIGRSGMIDTLSEDYITATYAKGMSRAAVNWKYAFKNVCSSVVTLVGMQIGGFLAGSVVVETVFSWPGIGQLMFQAVSNRDYALVQSLVLLSATFFAIINFVVDIINSLIDPRMVLQ